MNFEDRFLSLWNSIGDLEFPEEPEDTICIFALRFQAWVDKLFASINQSNIVSVNQAKILLTDKFFDWQRFVPQAHRQRMGIHGHTCVFQVFEIAYEKLRFVELGLTPPMIFIPQPPPPPPKEPPIVGKLFLGDDLDNDQ